MPQGQAGMNNFHPQAQGGMFIPQAQGSMQTQGFVSPWMQVAPQQHMQPAPQQGFPYQNVPMNQLTMVPMSSYSMQGVSVQATTGVPAQNMSGVHMQNMQAVQAHNLQAMNMQAIPSQTVPMSGPFSASTFQQQGFPDVASNMSVAGYGNAPEPRHIVEIDAFAQDVEYQLDEQVESDGGGHYDDEGVQSE